MTVSEDRATVCTANGSCAHQAHGRHVAVHQAQEGHYGLEHTAEVLELAPKASILDQLLQPLEGLLVAALLPPVLHAPVK